MQTVKFQHYYMGLEVVGSMAYYQSGRAGSKVRNRLSDFDLDVQPSLTREQAIQIALSVSGASSVTLPAPQLKILPTAQENAARLIYEINVGDEGIKSRQVTIDAHSGQVIANLSKYESIAPIEIHSAANQGMDVTTLGGNTPANSTGCTATDLASGQVVKQLTVSQCKNLNKQTALLKSVNCQLLLDGDPLNVDSASCPLASNGDDAATRAQQNSQGVLNFYLNTFNRNSYDGNGAPLVSVIHGGQQFDNAFWLVDANIMLYGDGDGKVMGDFTRGVDVAGHEMTHGVTSQTAKLTMMGESGALNEANSDFFGIMIANGGTDWILGQALFLNPPANGRENAIRDLANPGNVTFCAAGSNGQCTDQRPYPSTMAQQMPVNETCDDSNDNCWVHINATILGHASYLVSQAIGPTQAAQLYYTTLTQSLSASDTMTTAAQAYQQTCTQLFDSTVCSQVAAAFAQVGL